MDSHNIEKNIAHSTHCDCTKKIAGWVVKDQLVSIIQIINNDRDKPYLGALYTHPEFRRNGSSKALMSSFSNYLFENGIDAAGSMTAKDNPGSNKAIQECGFSPISEWIKVTLK